MSSAQKIIKYFAIALACLLIVGIISGIAYGFSFLGSSDAILEENKVLLETKENINNLKIDIKASSLIIKQSDTFKVETNNKYVDAKVNNGELKVSEKKHSGINSNNIEVIIYLPNTTFNEVDISTGAGKLDIEKLNTNILDFDLGAGAVSINNLIVYQKCDIDGGAGEVSIKNSNLTNLDLDLGVGKFTLHATLTGSSEIDQGVGEAIINLNGSLNDYQITLEKGVGTAMINNENITHDTTVGSGANKIDIDGGVGTITVNFN